MPNVLSHEDATAIANGIRSGRIKPEDKERAFAMLDEYKGQAQERSNFTLNALDRAPDADGMQAIAERAPTFASVEAQKEYYSPETSIGKDLAAARKGVDIHSGLSPEIRGKAALLNFNPESGAAALEELVRQSIPDGEVPAGIPLMGNIAGVPTALQRREDGSYKYVAINPTGGDLGDLAELAAELPQIAGEVAGGVAGAVTGSVVPGVGTAAGATVGSAVGSGIAGYFSLDARAALARKMGVPDEIVDSAVTDDARWWSAILAAGGDLAAAGVVGATRMIRNKSGGRLLEPEDVDRLMPEVQRTTKQAAEFKDRTGREIPLTLGQATGDVDIMQAEKIAQQRARMGSAQRIHTDNAARDSAVSESLKDISQQRVRGGDDYRPVEDVTQDVAAGIRGHSQAARREAETAEESLDEFQRVMDEGRSPETFVRVRDDAFRAAEDSRAAETEAWDNYRKEVGWKPGEGSNVQIANGDNSPIKTLLATMDDDAGRALLQSTKRSQKAFTRDAGLPAEEGDFPRGLSASWLDPRELHFTVSDLKRRVRQAERAADPDGFRVTDMRRMVSAIEDTISGQPMRYRRAGRSVGEDKAARVRESWTRANGQSVQTHTLFDNANMKALLERNPRTGDLAMPQGMIYKRMFAEGDSRFLDDAMEATGYNPRIRADLAEELTKKHRNATRTDVSGDAHRRFMDDHIDHIRGLGIDPSDLRGAQGLAQAARIARNRAEQVGRRLANQFGKRLSDDTTDPLNIHEELMNIGPDKVKNVVSYLRGTDPKLLSEVRNQSLSQLRRELSSKGDTEVAFGNLWKTLDTQSARLRELHGSEYVNDLKMFKRMEQTLKRDQNVKGITGQNAQAWWLDVTRSIFGPLSKKQRFISAVQRTNKRFAANQARSVISDPGQLHDLVRLRSRTLGDVLKVQGVRDLIAAVAGMDDNDLSAKVAAAREPTQNATTTAAAGNSIVPGRVSPAEAVGGQRPGAEGEATVAPSAGLGLSGQLKAVVDGADPAVIQAITDAAETHGVPVRIALAQAFAESGFDPKAANNRSNPGIYEKGKGTSAAGLFQHLTGTAAELGLSPDERFDPVKSADAGMRYLVQQHARFGNWSTALGAYHDGPGAMGKVLAGNRKLSPAGQHYIRKIMSLAGLRVEIP